MGRQSGGASDCTAVWIIEAAQEAMTHAFPCGITARSNDGAGDLFLAQMITGRRFYEFPGIRNLGPDVRFEIHEFDSCWIDREFSEKMRQLENAMLRHGYDCVTCRDPSSMTIRYRFYWRKPGVRVNSRPSPHSAKK